jgi:dTMP kinase
LNPETLEPLNSELSGRLIAFEGLDQSGKQTQAELLRDWLKQNGRKARLVSFPDYATSIGEEIARALQGEREYGPDVMQLLYIANRYERKPDLLRWLEGGLMLVSDRYTASSIAYGEALGLDAGWLFDLQKFLPPAWLTIFLDIAPETSVQRKAVDRDRYERDLALQIRVRESYHRLAGGEGWVMLDGERTKEAIAADVLSAVTSRLELM